jgi:hypothetical protein
MLKFAIKIIKKYSPKSLFIKIIRLIFVREI